MGELQLCSATGNMDMSNHTLEEVTRLFMDVSEVTQQHKYAENTRLQNQLVTN